MADEVSVGVLIGANRAKRMRKGNLDRPLRLLLAANEDVRTKLFFFTINDVNIQSKSILGLSWHKKDWELKYFDYPKAIYLRRSYSPSSKSLLLTFFAELEREHCLFINYLRRLDKWEMYKCLVAYPELKPYVPPTWPIRKTEEIKNLLGSIPALYLKACVSSRGRQIMRVRALNNGKYSFARYSDGLETGTLSWNGLLREILTFFNRKKIIAQKQIELVKVNGRNVDFRAEMYRQDGGPPKICGIPARISRLDSPITTHSTSMSLEKFCSQYGLLDYHRFMSESVPFLTRTYVTLENCFGESGELGIDFGQDSEGRLWFIEANSHSAKVSLFNSYPDDVLVSSFEGLLAYAIYRVNKN